MTGNGYARPYRVQVCVLRLVCSALVLVATALLAGCNAPGVPTQQNPSCSWEKAVPPHADAICRSAFRAIRLLVTSETRGDDAAIHRIVTTTRVARRIIAYGVAVRSSHLREFHAVPSITLDIPVPGVIGANADIRAKTPDNGKIKLSETIYMHVYHNVAYVFDDQAGEEW